MRNRARLVLVAFSCIAATCSYLVATEPESSKTASREAHTPEEAKQRLERLVDVDLVDVPIDELGDHIRHLSGIVVAVDMRAVSEAAEANPGKLVTFRARQLPTNKALNLILTPIDWDWSLYGGTLYLTSSAHAAQNLAVEVYDVHDLIYHGDDARYTPYDFDSLIEVITGLIAPTTWSEVGGAGSIKSFRSANRAVLVISQTNRVHRDVTELLARLRKLPLSEQPNQPRADSNQK